MSSWSILLLLVGLGLVATVLYWQLVITEGVFFGRTFVVWLYDITAHKYDAIKAYNVADETELVVEPVLAGTRTQQPALLDVATGTGRVPYFLLNDSRFDGTVVGLDASRRMLVYAQRNIEQLSTAQQARVQLLHHPAAPLPFPDASFDIVTSLETMEFLPDDAAALREMGRVLRAGGLLLVTRRREWEAYCFLHRYRSRASMTRLLQSMGLTAIQHHIWQNNYDLVTAFKSR